MKTKKPPTSITISGLSPDLYEKLRKDAEGLGGLSMTAVIRLILSQHYSTTEGAHHGQTTRHSLRRPIGVRT